LLPIVILTIIKGSPWHFALLLALFTFVGLLEFFAMALPDRKGELLPFALYGALTLFAPLLSDGRLVVMLCAGSFLLTALHFLFRLRDLQTVARDISLVATAYLYIPVPAGPSGAAAPVARRQQLATLDHADRNDQ